MMIDFSSITILYNVHRTFEYDGPSLHGVHVEKDMHMQQDRWFKTMVKAKAYLLHESCN